MATGSYLSIITLNVNGLNAPTKRQRLAGWIQKQDLYICCLQETHLKTEDTYRLKVKGWKKTFDANRDQKKAGVAILISDKIDFFFLTLFCFTILYWFCHTLTWISHGCTWVSDPEPPSHHPPHSISGSSPCTSPKHPVSCIKPGLAIRFLHDSIHVSMPFSQIIPSSPSPTESKSLF